MTKTLAPIVLFVYNRPSHTQSTLEGLQLADLSSESILYIYADGPKSTSSDSELRNILEVRRIIQNTYSFKKVHIVVSEKNKGLARSIIDGVTEVINKHERVIVLEDDLIVTKGFLKYCNEALELYSSDNGVMHISASNYDTAFTKLDDTFFLKVLSCNGWATWKRAWNFYNDDVLDHLVYFQADPLKSFEFDIEGAAYFMEQLRRNVSGDLNSWAVRWYASWLRAGGLSLFPKKSLLYNIGFDGSGENSGIGRSFLAEQTDYIHVVKNQIEENKTARTLVSEFWKSYLVKGSVEKNKPNVFTKQSLFVKRISKKILRVILIKFFPEWNPILVTKNQIGWSRIVQNIKGSFIPRSAKVYSPGSVINSRIGEYTYISQNSFVTYSEIGKFCSIGPNFCCGWGIHPLEGISTSPMFYSTQAQNGVTLSATNKVQERKKITIGNDVFIGMNVTVLDGVTIGDGAVIGAGCVVSKDVPPYAVVVGCPMQILRYRFDEITREKMLTLKWWDWPDDKLPLIEKHFFEVGKFLKNTDKGRFNSL
jgi:acetyltransferase-like isoleucine patch superfamily enzyme